MIDTIRRSRSVRAHYLAPLFFLVWGCDDGAESPQPDSGLPNGDATTDSGSQMMGGELAVETGAGPVMGLEEDGALKFLGIPYAKPPVGELRFAPPEPAEPWTDTLEASSFGPSCPQGMSGLSAGGEKSEDCLSLNVFAPPEAATEPRPVMVWIHGGAFISGGSSQYNGADLALAGDVIVVTVNYRLGAMGFMTHPALDDALGAPSGNSGLRDQQLALQWVHDNVAAFGGDPERVTVFGQSAGSSSACYQMFMPDSADLAQRFILQSGSCAGPPLGPTTKETATALSEALIAELCEADADPLTCLSELSWEELSNWDSGTGEFGTPWSPHVDGAEGVLPESPSALLARGEYNQTNLILGSTLNEWGLFQLQLLGGSEISTIAGLENNIDARIPDPDAAQALKDFYVPATAEEANAALVDFMSDLTFRCPMRTLASAATAHGNTAYLYSFDIEPAVHAQDIGYVFGQSSLEQLLGAPVDEEISNQVQGYWTRFAQTGDPNTDDVLEWPAFTGADGPHLVVADPLSIEMGLRKEACDLMASLFAPTE